MEIHEGTDFGKTEELDLSRSKLTGDEAKYAPTYIERDLVSYEVSDNGDKIFITSNRVLNYTIGTELEELIYANAAIINTALTNMIKFVSGKNNPAKYFDKCRKFIEEILEKEKNEVSNMPKKRGRKANS